MESLTLEDIHEGMSFSFSVKPSGADIDAFAKLTGDVNPLHMDENFAHKRGFAGRVVHGGVLNGYISAIFGVHLPGENCLVHSIKSSFLAPVIAGDDIEFQVTVKQISEAASGVIATTSGVNTKTSEEVMRGQVQFGFTQEKTT